METAIAAMAGSVAMAGTLGQFPRQGAAAMRVSSHKAFGPAKIGAQRFGGATKVSCLHFEVYLEDLHAPQIFLRVCGFERY